MAFNPFHSFRKHQKAIFAGLTIICMITFVFSSGMSGGGDFFSEIQRLVGLRRAAEVARLYGQSFDDRKIFDLRQRRELANQFMLSAFHRAFANMVEEIDPSPSFLDPSKKQRESPFDDSTRRQVRELVTELAQSGPQIMTDVSGQFRLQALDNIRRKLASENKNAQAQTIQEFKTMLLRLAQRHRDEIYPGSTLYFGGSLSLEGLLDFLIWRHEADRLGIQLTNEDIVQEIKNETGGRFTADDERQVKRDLGLDRRGSSVSQLSQALGDEFRVRLAQVAVLGYDPSGASQVPAPITPYEFWQFYQKNRTEVSVKLLPLNVRDFLAKVTEKPSEEELRNLFEQYKDQEAAPDKEKPGFKQPRRLKVEWIEASSDAKSYRQAASRWLLSLVAGTVSNPTQAVALAVRSLEEYENAKNRFDTPSLRAPALTKPQFALSFYTYAHLRRPGTAASLVAQLGAASTQGNALAVVVGNQVAAVAQESKDKDLAAAIAQETQNRAKKLAPLSCAFLSAGLSPSPVLTFGGIWQQIGDIKQYLPLSAVQQEVVGRIEHDVAQRLLHSSLANFRKEMEKRGPKDKNIEKFVNEEARKYDWEHKATEQLVDQYEIAKAANLQPLKEAYVSLFAPGASKAEQAQLFANLFFSERSPESSRLYTPIPFFRGQVELPGEKGIFLFWKTEDKPAQVLSFDEARPQVEAAWRLEKARQLAKAEAEKFAAEARKSKGDPIPNLLDDAKHYEKLVGQKTDLFDLNGIARLTKSFSPRAGLSGQYQDYKVPEDKIEYPDPNFVKDVLALKTKGDVTVLSDKPKEHYYVVALTNRNEPTIHEFQLNTTPLFPQRDFPLQQGNDLLIRFEQERQHEYRVACLERLRTQANLWINDEARKRGDERGTAPEE
jgi:hypothetical protein